MVFKGVLPFSLYALKDSIQGGHRVHMEKKKVLMEGKNDMREDTLHCPFWVFGYASCKHWYS